MNFQVGDIAIVKDLVNPYWATYVGTECTILEVHPTEGFGMYVAYLVMLVDRSEVGAQEWHLRKRNDYDGHMKCEWSDCIWQPDKVTIPVTVGEGNEEVRIAHN